MLKAALDGKLVSWSCLEVMRVLETNEQGQITKTESLGFTWVRAGEEPSLYEPDENGRMYGVPPKELSKLVKTTGEFPRVTLPLVFNSTYEQNSNSC
jgi:hypothetical protein